MTVRVDVHLEPGDPSGGVVATVGARHVPRGPSTRARVERFRADALADALGMAVRRARLLRTLRSVELRVVLETSDVVLRVRPAPSAMPEGPAPATAAAGAGSAPEHDGFASPVRAATDHDGAALEVRLAEDVLDEVIEGLARRRCSGSVRLELGPVVRARDLLRRVGGLVADRPGVIIDVSRAAVTVLELRGDRPVAARAVPAADPRTALARAAGPALAQATAIADAAAGGKDVQGGRAWVHLSAPPGLASGVRATCAELLPRATTVDVVRPPERPHAR